MSVLICQTSSHRNTFWKKVLNTLGISAIVVNPNRDLPSHIRVFNPQVVILDMNDKYIIADNLISKCREQLSSISIYLSVSKDIFKDPSIPEWAQQQGVTDLVSDLREFDDICISVKRIVNPLGCLESYDSSSFEKLISNVIGTGTSFSSALNAKEANITYRGRPVEPGTSFSSTLNAKEANIIYRGRSVEIDNSFSSDSKEKKFRATYRGRAIK